jgi:purine-cytosine permease-like protein
MNGRMLWSRILVVVGGIAMLLGTLDPLEGSLLILPGSGLVALSRFLGRKNRRTILYWAWAFILIAIGVGALFALSAVGGIGGRSGHSMWWGLLILPYPAGWLMALAGGVAGLVRFFKAKGQAAHA